MILLLLDSKSGNKYVRLALENGKLRFNQAQSILSMALKYNIQSQISNLTLKPRDGAKVGTNQSESVPYPEGGVQEFYKCPATAIRIP